MRTQWNFFCADFRTRCSALDQFPSKRYYTIFEIFKCIFVKIFNGCSQAQPVFRAEDV